jgi:HlyD family secretion protein
MKLITILIAGLLVFASGCVRNSEKADAYGNFESREIMISSELAGKLLAFDIHEGDKIKAGQICGLVDTTLLSIQKQQLNSKFLAILSQRSNLIAQEEILMVQIKTSEREINRVENLLKSGAATQKQMDDLQSSAEVLKMQIRALQTQQKTISMESEVIKFQIEQADEQIRRSRIISPQNGSVLVKYAEEGELVTPGKPLFKIGDLENLILRAYVSGEQLTGIKIGQSVKVLVDASGGDQKEYEGRIDWVSATAEFTPKIVQTKEERVSLVYAIKVGITNDGSLKIGMPGEIYFQ